MRQESQRTAEHELRLKATATVLASLVTIVTGFATSITVNAQSVYSPVILYREFYGPGRSFQMREDGSGPQELGRCTGNTGCGDLGHDGAVGHRFFIRPEPSNVAAQSNDLVVYTEDYNLRTVLVSDKSFHPVSANWSLDGNRISYYEYWCALTDASNQCIENRHGIVVADVVRDNMTNTPFALINERRVAEAISPDSLASPTWAPDDQHLAYSFGRWSSSGTVYHAYLVNVPPSTSVETPKPSEIVFSGGVSLNYLTLRFSPIKITDAQNEPSFRLAFQRITDKRPYTRFDIFSCDVPSSYNGSAPLPVKRISNGTNAKNFYDASLGDWSPDGQWLVYSASNGNLYAPHDVYKLKSDGTSKAINLTNLKTSMIYFSTSWR
jgi:hypothetical protein